MAARRRSRRPAAWLAVLGLLAAAAPVAAEDEPSPRLAAIAGSSVRLLTMQHLLRIGFEEKTRAELGGPFLRDYTSSLRIPQQWSDGDGGLINYVGHPAQGAASGFIWLAHDPRAGPEFQWSGEYLRSRLRAAAWAAGYSVQFEIGPLSEASLGNVGRDPRTAGWVDYVVTPAGGLALMVGEDAIDRFVIGPIERRVGSRVVRAAARMALNPSRAAANVASGRAPWYRDRPLAPPREVD